MKALGVSLVLALVMFVISMVLDFVEVYQSSTGNDDEDADDYVCLYLRNKNVALITFIVYNITLWVFYG